MIQMPNQTKIINLKFLKHLGAKKYLVPLSSQHITMAKIAQIKMIISLISIIEEMKQFLDLCILLGTVVSSVRDFFQIIFYISTLLESISCPERDLKNYLSASGRSILLKTSYQMDK